VRCPDAESHNSAGRQEQVRSRSPRTLTVLVALLVLLIAGLAVWFAVAGGERPAAPTASNPLLLAVLDVGQADSIFVRSPAGRTMLVDAGNERKDAEQVILPYFRRQDVQRLDYLVLSHPDQDHVGGMPTLLDSVPVGAFVDSVQPGATNQAYRQSLLRVQSKGIEPIKARRDQAKIDLGLGVTVQVLGPEDPLIGGSSSSNNNSVTLRLTYGSTSVFLAGDIEDEGEKRLLGHKDDLRSQILKVAHHGAQTSSSNEFLDALRPEVALISVGAGNAYGHPHQPLLQRLERRQVRVYRTDLNGTLQVVMDGRSYQISSERQGR